MVYQTWDTLVERLGSGTSDLITEANEFVARQTCTIARKYPNALQFQPFIRGFINSRCTQIDEPIATAESIKGGQCYTLYRLFGTAEETPRPSLGLGCFLPAEWGTGDLVPGKITNLVFNKVVNQNIQAVISYELENGTTGTVVSSLFWRTGPLAGTSATMRWSTDCRESNHVHTVTNLDNIEFRREDGLPDNCGNLDPQFPPDEPFDPADFTGTTVINNYNNQSEIIETYNYDYDFGDLNANFYPVNVTFGGVNIQVDIDGFKTEEPDSGGGGANTTTYKDPFDDDSFVLIFPPNADGTEPDTIEDAEEVEEIEEEAIDINWILVDVTTLPDKPQMIKHESESNIDIFAGYFAWIITTKFGSYQMPRMQLRKTRNAFLAPPEATGYIAYTVYNAKIKVTKYKSTSEN